MTYSLAIPLSGQPVYVNGAPPYDFGLGQGWDSPMPDAVPKTGSTSNAKRDAFLEAYRRQWEANRKHSTADCSLHAMQAIVEASMRRQGTPQSTVDALLHVLRRDGISCFNEPINRTRLASCDEQAIRQIIAELKAWSESNIVKLTALWEALI